MSFTQGLSLPPEDRQPPPPEVSDLAEQVRPRSAERVVPAGFWIRVLAWIIDGIALGILTSAIAPSFGAGAVVTTDGSSFAVDYGANGLGVLFGLIYFAGMWSYRGQTLGMIPFRLWVVRADDGGPIDILQALLRYVGLIISFAVVLLGVIWVAFDGRKQGWHDKLAGTLVVRR